MKKFFVLTLLVFLSYIVHCQTSVLLSYNAMHIGRNYNFNMMHKWGNHSILYGVKYLKNNIVADDQFSIFKGHFFATNSKQHWGLSAGYRFDLPLKFLKIQSFLFYDFQYTYSHTRNLMFNLSLNHPGEELYIRSIVFFGPTYALEHNIGIGIQQQIFNSFYLIERIGTGLCHFIDIDKRLWGGGNVEVGSLLSIGLLYRLK